MNNTDLTPLQAKGIQAAHDLADMGCAIFVAHRDSSHPLGDDLSFMRPNAWQHTKPGAHGYIDRWRPGMGLAMVTGIVFDVIDVDPRNGGREGYTELGQLLGQVQPILYGLQSTPSGGEHRLIRATGLAKGKLPKGVDFQAGARNGEGRGYIWLAPTERISKWGPRKGELVDYRWESGVGTPMDTDDDPGRESLIEYLTAIRAPRRTVIAPAAAGPSNPEDDLFEPAGDWTAEEAERVIRTQLTAVENASNGTVNATLGGAARVLGRFVAGGYLSDQKAVELLEEALENGGVHSDSWNAANGLKWTARTVIAAGLENGAKEPWTVDRPETGPAPVTVTVAAGQPPVGTPRLLVESAAVMSYWLQQEIGRGRLSGFFSRGGLVVHTPRVDEVGYVAPDDEADSNGPAEIRPVTADTLAAKLQFLFACYKTVTDKETKEKREVPAMFPQPAAKVVVNAPEAMVGLRALKGVTHTPMVRADGTILDAPGYDPVSGYIFLPAGGVKVPTVPSAPTVGEVEQARTLLGDMIAGFPFATADDRANYLGMLITPLLREVCPPPYKLLGIGAHQPGSGKSLLAQILQQVHGAVWRSETPEDEAEWRKATSSLLATTSAPVVVMDNISGVLRSSVLAGLLTAVGPQEDRDLGTSRNITFTNDRLWVVTGNNLSLGGDLVRRTIVCLIDPDMANPETRTGFAITDLPRWVGEHRNEILWSLLVLVRAWVAAGRPLEDRKQSDGFATWEKTVGGILNVAGIPGAFDAQSGQKAAAGGDDDGLATVLETLAARYGAGAWSVAQALTDQEDAAGFVIEGRDWVPTPVLDKLSRSEPSGRASMGKWLRFRLGRWVTGSDGRAYALREAGRQKHVALWAIEVREVGGR